MHPTKRVSVLVRVRPALPRELESSSFVSAVAVVPEQRRVFVSVEDKPVLINGSDTSALPDHVRSFETDAVLGSEASQDDVVEALDIRREAVAVIQGVNSTILAYGQTGSGKTYTMGTEGDSNGIISQAADALFSSGSDIEVYATYLQLYRDTITDLLSNSGETCRLREAGGKFRVEGLRQVAIQSAGDVCELLAEGAARRAVACTKLNATSSRSHAVLTFHVSCEHGEDQVSHAQWTFVDLAGSERVKESGVTGEALKEACSINGSLNALINVVRALRNRGKGIVPYRDHKLTMILREAIGGNSATWLVATVSPAQLHGRETSNTLGFAVACGSIQNTIVANVAQRSAAWREAAPRPKPKPTAIQVPWEGAAAVEGRVVILDTPLCQIAVTLHGEGAPAVLLHGYPSNASEWEWLVPALLHAGYQAIAIDMPGCGHSPGPELKTHSRFNLEKGGACEVVCAAIDALGLRRVTFIGYDWGAGVALSLGIGWRTRCERLVSFHPSYNVMPGGELSRIRTPLLVIWVKEDQFHPLPAWKKISRELSSDIYEFEVFSVGHGRKHFYGVHPIIGAKIQARIAKFLGWVDATNEVGEIACRLEQASTSTTGAKVTEQRNVVLTEEAQDADIARGLTERLSSEASAVREFRAAMAAGQLQTLYAKAPAVLFGALPKLSPEVLRRDMEVLLRTGLWSALPGSWDAMQMSPRYFVGRQVLVRAHVCPFPASPLYMSADAGGKLLTTHRSVISGFCSEGEAIVDVEGGSSQGASSQELLCLNQPHLFREERQAVCFEDGLKCNYNRPLTRAKMAEIAIRLGALVESLDFSDPSISEEVQLECVRIIRDCIDIVTFQRGLDRSRACAMCDDVARFAVNGQGHCHTVSSVMAAFLYPWTELLGIDLCYRGGFSFRSVNPNDAEVFAGEVADNPERHQWLEISLRPRMPRYVVDLWVEDGGMGAPALRWPAEQAYQERMYPHGQLRIGQSTMPVTSTDWAPGEWVEEG